MSNLIRGELYKLRKSKYTIGAILLTLASAFLLKDSWEFEEIKLMIHKPNEVIYGITSLAKVFSYIRYTSFIFALLAGEFIAKEFKNRNISKSFSYGYKRSSVILSKLIVLIPTFLFLELLYIVILVTYASRNNGFCEVLDYNTLLYLFRLLAVGVLYNIAVISIVIMSAIITKNNFYTIATPVIFSVIYKINSGYLSYFMPSIAVRDAMEKFATQADVVKSIVVSSLVIILTIGGSLLYIERSDIK